MKTKLFKRMMLAAMALVMVLSLIGCGEKTDRLTFSTGGTTGVYYSFGGEIATLWNSNIDNMEVTVQSSGGSKDNVLALYNDEADIAWVQNDVMSYAYNGDDFFDGTVADNFSALGAIYPESVQLVVAKDSGITCVEDLAGHNVSVGPVGSGHYFNAMQILDVYDMTIDDINAQYLSNSEVIDAFQNKQIDAFFLTAAYPHATVTDVSMKRDIEVIGFDEATIAKLQEKYPFYVTDTMPDGTYEGVEGERLIPAISAVLVVNNNVSEETAYNLTKALFENVDSLTNAKKSYISVENAIEGIPTCAADAANGVTIGSFHPGALKYYQEIGIIK